jgi:hypothetical protein
MIQTSKKMATSECLVAVGLAMIGSYIVYFNRGGKLKSFLVYDLIICLLCIALFVFLALDDGGQ